MLVGADVVSSPADTLLRAVSLLKGRNFWHDAESTGIAFGYACVIGILGGMLLGLALGLNRFAGDVADPILGTVYSIPKITLYPIILLIFGLSLHGKGRVRRDPWHFSGGHFHHERGSQRRAGASADREGVAAIATGNGRHGFGPRGNTGDSGSASASP